MVEVLSGVLSGAGVAHAVRPLYGEREEQQDVGHFHLALDPARLVGGAFAERLSALPAVVSVAPC
jgi:LDH2 family malate/lactate/ureidoglycolate dehydrogenase